MNKKEYAEANKEWLRKKALEPNVEALDKGVLYRVIAGGDPRGKSPSASSVVVARYAGSTIDGHVFDSSGPGVPPAFRLRELIPGWIIALGKMKPGDRWEIYIPAELGYGKFSQPDIPANSTLIFDIELVSFS